MKATVLGGDIDALTGDERCIYTVSVDPSGIREAAIFEGFAWVKGRFRDVLPLIGDGPLIERTAKITGVDPVLVERRVSELAARLPGALPMSRLALAPDFSKALKRVSTAAAVHADFRRGIDDEAQTYVDRVARRGDLAVTKTEAARLSREYIEHEVAMYLCMAVRGYLIDVYVGRELTILKRFIDQEFGLLLSPLEQRIFIGLEGRKTP